MTVAENVILAPYTTFGIGGPAAAYLEVRTDDEIKAALAYARERGLCVRVLGAGSNLLVPDEGIKAVVLRIVPDEVSFEEKDSETLLITSAGLPWERAVDAAASEGLYGIELLAGIPGTIGGGAVQNIGAYGAELSAVFAYADTIDLRSGERRRVSREEAAYGYRTSYFKNHRELIITRVALGLSRTPRSAPDYPDIARARETGVPLGTPREIASAVRQIRRAKFPRLEEEGTAGSFFKNLVVRETQAAALKERFPELPVFPQEDGMAKVSLAWILDHALGLKGYAIGAARLFEKQPLVLVARRGASSADVDLLARDVQARVHAATGIMIEREVETFACDAS